jgi:predicted Zn-dependent peptidase
MKRVAWLFLVLTAAAQDDIPDHPDKLKYKALQFDVPNPDSMRVALPNNAAAYLLEDPALPLVHLQIQFRGGSFWIPRDKAGLAGMTGTVMRTGGTQTRAPRDLDEELDFLAAELSVGIGDTSGSANLSVLSKDLDKGLEILLDVLKNPEFRQEKIDLLKAQMMDSLKARNDSTAGIEGREAGLLFYGDYPSNVLPTKASVESITREDMIALHQKLIHPSNFIIAAAGNFKRDEMAKKLEKLVSAWDERAPNAFDIPPVAHVPKPGVYVIHNEGKNINQGRVTIGHRGIKYDHPDAFALRVMNYVYGGGGFSSRLMQKVRSDEGLAYDVHSAFQPGILYTGTMRIRFQSKSESCLYAAKLCVQELERVRKDGVTEQELKETIQFYLDGFPGFFFSTPFDTVKTFANAELLGLPKDYYHTYREKLAKVTQEDCKRVANELLKPENFLFIFVGNIPAIRRGDGVHEIKIEEFGPVTEIPLPDPLTLERPAK